MLRRAVRGSLVVYGSPLLEQLGVPHAFTTRCREGDTDLDLGGPGGAPEGLLLAALGLEGGYLHELRQVHGAHVEVVPSVARGAGPADDPGLAKDAAREGGTSACPEGDALVTTDSRSALLVRVADCVPVLLAAGDGRRVAAVHAGWRGLVAGVIPRAVELLGGGTAVAAIGPCLSVGRFEVGPEVADRFRELDLGVAVDEGLGPRPHVDLRLAARVQLERSGVRRVDVSDRCTWESEDELWSYRRDVTRGGRPGTGRQGAIIAPRPAAG